MFIYFLAILLALLVVSYVYFTRNFDYWRRKNVPYIKPLPYFGNCLKVFLMQKSMGKTFQEIYLNNNKPFLGIFVCDEPCLLIKDLDAIKNVLVKDFECFDNRSVTQNIKDDPIGSSILFLLRNPQWYQLRKKVTVVYTAAKIKAMHGLILEAIDGLINHIKTYQNQKINIGDAMQKFATDAITSTAFGINANCFRDEKSEFDQAAKRINDTDSLGRAISVFCYFLAPNLVKLFKMRALDKGAVDFLRDVFWKVLHDREEKKFVRHDVIDALIEIRKSEEHNKIDDFTIVAQAVTFFVGGHDTLSATLAFLFYELAANLDVQEHLREEVLKTKENHDSFTYDVLKDMEYLEMCLKETLRKYPVATFLDRKCNTHYKIPDTNVTLEPNTTVFIPTLGLHYDENFFPNAKKFDPLRFSPDRIHSIPAYAYLPFGEGPRTCIGVRYAMVTLKSVAVHILSQFEVHLAIDPNRNVTIDNKGFLLRPKDVFLTFKQINK